MLRTADSTKRLRFLSDLVRVEKKAGKSITNTSAGEQLLRFLRGSGFQAPVLIGTTSRTLWKTEFVKQYLNAGSCSSYAIVTDYIHAMKTGVDGEHWKTYSAVWHRENHPFLITVHAAPGEASKHIQFAASLGVENISLPSTLAARDWFRVHKGMASTHTSCLRPQLTYHSCFSSRSESREKLADTDRLQQSACRGSRRQSHVTAYT